MGHYRQHAVALMHIVLVIPAELLNFTRDRLIQPDYTSDGYQVYNSSSR